MLVAYWAQAAADLEEADLMLATMTVNGRDFASAYATERALTYIPAVSGIDLEPKGLHITRITYGGLAQEETTLRYPLVIGMVPGIWGITPTLNGNPEMRQLTIPSTNNKKQYSNRKKLILPVGGKWK